MANPSSELVFLGQIVHFLHIRAISDDGFCWSQFRLLPLRADGRFWNWPLSLQPVAVGSAFVVGLSQLASLMAMGSLIRPSSWLTLTLTLRASNSLRLGLIELTLALDG